MLHTHTFFEIVLLATVGTLKPLYQKTISNVGIVERMLQHFSECLYGRGWLGRQRNFKIIPFDWVLDVS